MFPASCGLSLQLCSRREEAGQEARQEAQEAEPEDAASDDWGRRLQDEAWGSEDDEAAWSTCAGSQLLFCCFCTAFGGSNTSSCCYRSGRGSQSCVVVQELQRTVTWL